MRAVIQRVRTASVEVDGEVVGEIDRGLMVLLGVGRGDERADADWMARKIARLRVFPDDSGRMNLDVTQVGGGVLLVSQFTLYGDARQGNRPGFSSAADPADAAPLVDRTASELRGHGVPIATGTFGASMLVDIQNDGPVTILLDTEATQPA